MQNVSGNILTLPGHLDQIDSRPKWMWMKIYGTKYSGMDQVKFVEDCL